MIGQSSQELLGWSSICLALTLCFADRVELVHRFSLEFGYIVTTALLFDLVVLDLADELECTRKFDLVCEQLALVLSLLGLE